ncbi:MULTISPECIES: cold shock domain-containing protein CspD [Thalassolituus]|mgnify:FL=1|jgi:CspA family cold shock protein|uniref:Cold shock-like protein CspD n=2 Tax=Thalassolituus oleivorans TaxID=187493 RepID=M5DSP3_9GAMM|nr:cold shock domain-containing protein CspD [Thalassolituus oleivorans]APR67115.1 cold shock domain protein CspD [Thalassolituus oleivorans]MBQ0780599.1 cold shock domain-containing protein CspD [Thalassolituus oleivorans]MCA6128625.1 cold-shock protein [Thalassolituus oleivorans 4BN06-13]MDF1641771.1 cold shock domain-containing protein CspD [Thalassolituus oleivorans]CCU72217.1 cold-inducible RNA chaperone and anti-terminator [Thalassolituus oleivorans MIL-1]
MKTGKVKWFNNAKGYGFILADDSNEDLFAHYSTIQMDGYRTLKAGQAVQFDIKPSDKGSHAINIRALDVAENEQAPITTQSEQREYEDA